MSTKAKPKLIKYEPYYEDYIFSSIDELYLKFIRNIDNVRSLGVANGVGGLNRELRTASEMSVDLNNFTESRTHAFYRMIGFPVVSQDGFYQSGHDPKQSLYEKSRKIINNSLSLKNNDIIRISLIREAQSKERRDIFKNITKSKNYCVLMRNSKPFNMANSQNIGNAFFIDNQIQPIAGRKDDIEKYQMNSDNVNEYFYNVSHILKPFVVIPDIESSVVESFKRRICVPFLPSVDDTATTKSDKLKRPIIEYVIRKRLTAVSSNDWHFERINKLIDSSNYYNPSLESMVLALNGANSLSTSDINSVKTFNYSQFSSINYYIGAIKYCIKELDRSIKDYNSLLSSNFLMPFFNNNIESIGYVETTNALGKSYIDKKLDLISATEVSTDFISKIDSSFSSRNIGDEDVYIANTVSSLMKDFSKSKSKLSRNREQIGRDAINCLKTIEYITGEVSGLGLIDIFAFYTALWAIDLEYLIGLLDNNSLTRLATYFPEIVNDQIKKQVNGNRPDIFECLKQFEKVFFNVLSYSDNLLVKHRQSPVLNYKGSL